MRQSRPRRAEARRCRREPRAARRLFEGLDGGLRCRERPTEAAHFGVHGEGRWSRFLFLLGFGSGSGSGWFRFGSGSAQVRFRFWLGSGSGSGSGSVLAQVLARLWLRFRLAPAQALVEDRRLEARWVGRSAVLRAAASGPLLGGPPGGPPGVRLEVLTGRPQQPVDPCRPAFRRRQQRHRQPRLVLRLPWLAWRKVDEPA